MKKYTLALPFLFATACEVVQPETTVIPQLDSMVSCTDFDTNKELTIAASTSDNTVALVIYDPQGFESQGTAWGEGMEDRADVELHVGTNVGINYCTDEVVTENITEVYKVIDSSELPEGLQTGEETSLGYAVMFPLCEGCGPIAEIDVQNLWFVSEDGDYVQIESTTRSVDITYYQGD